MPCPEQHLSASLTLLMLSLHLPTTHSPPWSLLCSSIHQLIPPPWSFTLLLLLPPKMPFPHVSPWLHLFSYSDSSLNITSPESIFLILSLNEHPTCLHSFFIMSLSIVFHSLSLFFLPIFFGL